MRSINGRFLLISLGLIAIVGIGANLLHAIQVRRSAGILLELGTRKIAEGRPAEALSYLTRYAKLAPHNADAQFQLASALSDTGRIDAAIRWYEQALLRDASRHDARRRLVELSIAARRFPVAKAHLVDYLLPYTPDDPQVYYLLGLCHDGLGEYDEACNRLREAIDRDPKLVAAYAPLATLLRVQKEDPDGADAVMEQMVSANGENAQAFIIRADYRARYRLGNVVDDVRKAVALAPDAPDILFRSARMALDIAVEQPERHGLLDNAEQLLQKGIAMEPRFPGWYLGMAQVERSRGSLDKAVACVEEGLVAAPNDGDLQWNLADLLIQQDRIDEGLGIVARLRDQGHPRVPLEYLVALADVRRKQFVDASERLAAIRGQMDNWPELARQTEYWLGICYERLGEYGLQLTAFRNAAKIDPTWIPARQWLANALGRTGRIEEAITEYEELAKLTGVPRSVYRELSRLIVLRELQRNEQQRNWPRVTAFLEQVSKVDPDAADYILLQAEVQSAQGDREAARATLEASIRKFPQSVSTYLGLAALEQSADRWSAAEQLIDTAEQKFGDIEEVRLARLRYLVQRYGTDSYAELKSLEERTALENTDSQQRWRTSLAAAYYTLGKQADARRLWQQAIDDEPDNIRLRIFMFDLALSEGDDAQMKDLLEGIGRIERSDERPLWHYGEATRLVVLARKGDTSALHQAERLLEEVRAARGTWSRIPLLEAEIDEIRGAHDKMVEHYLAAIELGERSPMIVRRVVELLYQQRRYADADRILRRFESTQLPITGELGRLAADVAFRVQDFSRAMQIAVQAIGNSEAYEDLVWMAQLQSVMGERASAEEGFRKAIGRRPEAPDAWIALVQHFVRTDSPDMARRAIQVLARNVAPDSVPFVEAICLRALQDNSGALARFDDAAQSPNADPAVLRTAADFYLSQGLVERSGPVLERLMSHPDVSKSDVQWARRNLAITYLAAEDPASRERSLALVSENLADDPSSADDRRAKAVCLQALGGEANLKESLAIIEDLLTTDQAAPADQIIAHQLCLALNRPAEARRYLEQHTFENSSDPQNVVRYIRFVIDQNELREAQIWINRLDQLCADGFASRQKSRPIDRLRYHQFFVLATGLRAQLMQLRGNTAGAAKQIVDSLGTTADEGPSLSSREAVQLLASLARQLAASDESAADSFRESGESLLRERANRSAPHGVALVLYLVSQGRMTDATASWQKYFDVAAADDFSIVAAVLSAQPQLASSDLAALTTRIESLPKDARSKAVLSGLAQLYSFQDRHADAIAAFREILAKHPDDAAAMNNLACYLALSGDDREEALRLVDGAISIVGATPSLLDSRGLVLLEMGRPEEARADLERSIKLRPDGATYLHLAAACKRLNQDKASDNALKMAQQHGLNIDSLHPLERRRYAELLKQAAL